MPETACLKVPKNLGETAIRLVRELDLFNSKLKVQQVDDCLCIPLTAEPSPAVLSEFEKKLPNYEISVHAFAEREKRHLLPLDFLADKLPTNLLASSPPSNRLCGRHSHSRDSPRAFKLQKADWRSVAEGAQADMHGV